MPSKIKETYYLSSISTKSKLDKYAEKGNDTKSALANRLVVSFLNELERTGKYPISIPVPAIK